MTATSSGMSTVRYTAAALTNPDYGVNMKTLWSVHIVDWDESFQTLESYRTAHEACVAICKMLGTDLVQGLAVDGIAHIKCRAHRVCKWRGESRSYDVTVRAECDIVFT